MKYKRLLAGLILGAFVGVSGSALAQGGPGRGHPGGPGGPAKHMSHPGGPHGVPPGHKPRPHAGPPGHAFGHADPAYRHWVKGQRVPLPYRGPQYVVVDWRGHHLPPPPRGHRWINVGADYFLIGVATGVVLQSILAR